MESLLGGGELGCATLLLLRRLEEVLVDVLKVSHRSISAAKQATKKAGRVGSRVWRGGRYRQDSATGDGSFDQGIQFLVTADGELQVSGRDTFDLQVLCGVASEFEDFGRKVLQDGRAVHTRLGADSHATQSAPSPRNNKKEKRRCGCGGILVLGAHFHETTNTADGELARQPRDGAQVPGGPLVQSGSSVPCHLAQHRSCRPSCHRATCLFRPTSALTSALQQHISWQGGGRVRCDVLRAKEICC